MLAGIVFAPSQAILSFELMLAGVFICWMAMRLGVGAFIHWPQVAASRIPDRELPVYTIVAALYREAASVNGLLSAIERFDYPVLGSSHTCDCYLIPRLPAGKTGRETRGRARR